MTTLRTLFSPIAIGSMSLRNRLVMSPMTTDYGSDEGRPSERLLDYLETRARGGVGLITLEGCTVDRRHREVVHSLHLSDDAVVADHRAVTERVHEHGAKIQPQIIHPGPDSLSQFFEQIPPVGPSPVPGNLTGMPCRELAKEELAEIVAQYGAAARRAREAGYDGVELHAAHGYMLLGSFLSPWRNKRTDEYGGRKAEGRLRLILEVIERMKSEAGRDFPITLRIAAYERIPTGRPLGETTLIAPILQDAGIDAFHVSGGVADRLVTQIVTGAEWGAAHNVALAEAVKRVVDVPVMTVGRIHDPRDAEAILRRGQADLVCMARPLLADPELPNKAERGAFAEIRRCISCQTCIDSMERSDMVCAINGAQGREGERSFAPAARAKRVVVVGGGPGGLEAARVAALRGHAVTLCESRRRLGGSLLLASTVHRENESLLDYLTSQVEALGVDVRLGETATPSSVRRMAADAVVVATGGRLVIPQIPGADLPHVLTGAMLRHLLSGELDPVEAAKLPTWQRLGVAWAMPRLEPHVTPERIRTLTRRWMPIGERVVIVGADLAAIELAEFLADRGRRVAVLEAGERIAPEVGKKRRTEHMKKLDGLGVSLNLGITVERITPSGLIARPNGREPVDIAADTVVLAGEVEADTRLLDGLRGAAPEVHAVGDCTGLGLIKKAIEDGVRVGCAL